MMKQCDTAHGGELFVTDLDGTLLGADSRVSQRSAAILSELTRRGALITAATARTPATVEPLLAETEIHVPAVVMTGAGLWDHAARRFASLRLMDSADAKRVTELTLRLGLHPIVYRAEPDGSHLTFRFDPTGMPSEQYRFIADRANLELKRPVVTADPVGEAAEGPTVLILAMGSDDAVMAAVKALRGNPALSVSYYTDPVYPGVVFLEVFGPRVNKAEGLRELKRLTGAERLTVFGDSFNDLSMMNVADRAVAVENALPEVKAAADTVIGPNTDDSVALFIARELGHTDLL